jgi:hypothetical protein
MTTKEAINRGNNLLGVAIVALSGFAFFPDTFAESEFSGKFDELLMLLVGIIAIIWYKLGNNRFSRSATPIVLVIVSLVIKLIGIYLERGDAADLGDEFGGAVLLTLAAITLIWIHVKNKKTAEDSL